MSWPEAAVQMFEAFCFFGMIAALGVAFFWSLKD